MKVQAIKDLLIKGCGSRFYRESSSLNARDKDLRSKWLSRPLIGELFNDSHLRVVMLYSSGTAHGTKKMSRGAPFFPSILQQWVYSKLFYCQSFLLCGK